MNLYRASLLLALSLGCVMATRAENMETPEEWVAALQNSSVQDVESTETQGKTFSTNRSIGPRRNKASSKIITRCVVKTEGKIPIRFARGSSRIIMDATTDRQFDALVSALGGVLDNATLLVAGHTDADGDDSVNLRLSKQRAAAVLRHLVKKYKVDRNSVKTKGYGEYCPIDTSNGPTAKEHNRRVEFALLPNN